MAKTYEFKTDEDIDTLSRTILATETVTEKKVEEFTLEQREDEIASLKEQKANIEERVAEKEAELAKIKEALGVN